MSNRDYLIYAQPAEWDAVNVDPDTSPLSKRALSVFTQANTGWWDTFVGGYEAYNVLCSESVKDEIVAQLTDVYDAFPWNQGSGLDEFNADGTFAVEPDDYLAIMKPHITYDQDGNPTGSTPATFENPNDGHVKYGQIQRRYGEFSIEFSEDFK